MSLMLAACPCWGFAAIGADGDFRASVVDFDAYHTDFVASITYYINAYDADVAVSILHLLL